MASIAISPRNQQELHSSQTLMSSQRVAEVERRLRRLVNMKRLRVSEFFKDFDPLRSGNITLTQFRRCLDQHLGLGLTDDEHQLLASKYDPTGKGLINYRLFCNAMGSVFNADILDGKPDQQISSFQQSCLSSHTLTSELKSRTDQLLLKCSVYYKTRGISIKECYKDFDRHGKGYVTQSQFHRSFPGPPEVSEQEIDCLAQRYYDHSSGLYNYLNFHYDVRSICQAQSKQPQRVQTVPSASEQTDYSLQEIFKRIRDVVYKLGIRTTEYFTDHDKLRSGIITENQFVCGLSLCIGQWAHLTREEIDAIVRHYKTSDGRVMYKEFCDIMENAYNEPNLEKRPTAVVNRPLRGYLHKPLNSMIKEEEQHLELLLQRLKREVKERRLLLYPYFRDFDRGKGYTRGVTKPQFERLLHFLSISVSAEELKLLVRKFEDPVGGDINYSAFIQAVDEEYVGQVLEVDKTNETLAPPPAPVISDQDEEINVDELIGRIRELVLVNRVRVCEHFQDFDPLRSGSISTARFRQGLTAMGQTSLTEGQFRSLCQQYADPSRQGYIKWKVFLHDVDAVFQARSGQPALRTHLLPVGAVDFTATATVDEKSRLSAVLSRLSQRASQKRLLIKPCFQDFDKHNTGHISNSQFKQSLSFLDLPASEEELVVLEKRFSDAKGFNYLQFLSELEPTSPLEDKYQHRMQTIMELRNSKQSNEVKLVKPELAKLVMDRIKTKVSKERIRVLEFLKDYDKLRSGDIPATSFRRALDLCGFMVNDDEIIALEERYRSNKDPSCVDYVTFSDEIESIFTIKELEKMPTIQVTQFVPPVEVDLNQLSPEEAQILQKCMHRLAERVRVRRIQLFPLFEDYDRVHIGSVSKGQFHRVLSELELGSLVGSMEFGIIYRRFGVQVGGRNDVNYISFCAMIEEYALTRWTDPALK